PEYDTMAFDYDKAAATVARWSKLANAKDADLSKFSKRGGKLIMTYGWADQILQPLMGVKYYESVVAKNGPQTMDFARLFMLPGMTHCAGGIGPDVNDAVTAVIDWVEKGKAPDQLIASKRMNDQLVRSRPLCPYPQVARYKGQGSIDDAANFSCVGPNEHRTTRGAVSPAACGGYRIRLKAQSSKPNAQRGIENSRSPCLFMHLD